MPSFLEIQWTNNHSTFDSVLKCSVMQKYQLFELYQIFVNSKPSNISVMSKKVRYRLLVMIHSVASQTKSIMKNRWDGFFWQRDHKHVKSTAMGNWYNSQVHCSRKVITWKINSVWISFYPETIYRYYCISRDAGFLVTTTGKAKTESCPCDMK